MCSYVCVCVNVYVLPVISYSCSSFVFVCAGPFVCCESLLALTVWTSRWFPGTRLRCPSCKQVAAEEVRWGKIRLLHMMDQQAMFIATRHSCLRCTAAMRGTSKRRRWLTFCASEDGSIQMLPHYAQLAWTARHCRAGYLADDSVIEFIRASATRSTWTKVAAILNELRATKIAKLNAKYMSLCDELGLEAVTNTNNALANAMLSNKWVADIYEADIAARRFDITSELLAEQPADIISVDWTHDAGARCSGKWMFNVTDANGKVLNSVVTATAAPAEVEPVMRELHLRGTKPRIIYVDCECCGAWRQIINKFWPDAHIVLDSFHAIRRLTQTTSSPKHPWHSRFCRLVSQAVFIEDSLVSSRFRKAMARSMLSQKASARLKAECVKRHIKASTDIEKCIDYALVEFENVAHEKFGPLLTPKTFAAWSALKIHIRNGCLRDPPDVELQRHMFLHHHG